MKRHLPNMLVRIFSRMVAAYPFVRGKTRLRRTTSRWLVGHLPFGTWVRVSGAVDAEWQFLSGYAKEDATTKLVKSFLRPGMTFVDVGANVGYFTLLAASMGARVIAYEPTPEVCERLCENVKLNSFDRVTVVNAAVMDKPGRLSLYQSTADPEANNLFGQGDRPIEVEAVSLDFDLQSRGVQEVDLLKIDAEGAEPFVLDGASALLRSKAAPSIIVEVNPVSLRSAHCEPAALIGRLKSAGYYCRELERFVYMGEPVLNILATPSSADYRRGLA